MFKKYFLPLLILLACSWSLFFKGLGYGHDLNHQARIFEMTAGLRDDHFPVIWSQNLSYGYGMPIFEFYAPLPYYVGAIFNLLGFNITVSIKLLIFCSHLITFLGTYYLTKKLFKNKSASLLASATVTLAPYRAVDLIRTAHSELWAISFLPFTMLGIIKIIEKEKRGWLVMSLSFAAILLSHNITALIATPFLVLFALLYLFFITKTKEKKILAINRLILSGILSLALAAFYFIPALLEKSFTQIDQYVLGPYSDIGQHFLYIRQFFKPWGSWEYGGSVWGPYDGMSFFLGFAQLLIFVVAGLQIMLLFKKKKTDKNYRLQTILLVLTGISLFLTLLKTQFLWRLIPIGRYVQFPWRLLGIYLIFAGILAASSYLLLPKKWQGKYFYLIMALLLSINTGYFISEKYTDYTALYNNYRPRVLNQHSTAFYDYLPKGFSLLEKNGFHLYQRPTYTNAEIPSYSVIPKDLQAQTSNLVEKVHKKEFVLYLESGGEISFNLAYYPGWTAKVNGEEVEIKSNEDGLVTLYLDAGENDVELRLKDTPIRRWGKVISLVGVVITMILIIL